MRSTYPGGAVFPSSVVSAHVSHAPPPKRFGAQEAAKRLQKKDSQFILLRIKIAI